jgi:hypothetical protein
MVEIVWELDFRPTPDPLAHPENDVKIFNLQHLKYFCGEI